MNRIVAVLVNAALSANEIAAAAPNQADRQAREPKLLQARQTEMAAAQVERTMTQPLVDGIVVPPPALLIARKRSQSRHGEHRPDRLAPAERRAEPHPQDDDEEDELGDHERLHDAQSRQSRARTAWKPNDPIMAASPTYQIGRRIT